MFLIYGIVPQKGITDSICGARSQAINTFGKHIDGHQVTYGLIVITDPIILMEETFSSGQSLFDEGILGPNRHVLLILGPGLKEWDRTLSKRERLQSNSSKNSSYSFDPL